MIDVMIVGMTVLEEVILVEEVVVAVTAEMMIGMVAMIVIVVMIERGEMTVMTGATTVEMERDVHKDQGDSDAPDETRGRAREWRWRETCTKTKEIQTPPTRQEAER